MPTKYTLTEKDTGKTVHTYDPDQAADLYVANRNRGIDVEITSQEEKDNNG